VSAVSPVAATAQVELVAEEASSVRRHRVTYRVKVMLVGPTPKHLGDMPVTVVLNCARAGTNANFGKEETTNRRRYSTISGYNEEPGEVNDGC
jgi:hypothetical protein